MKSEIDAALLRQNLGIAVLQVEYRAGFWGAFMLFAAAAILTVMAIFQKK